MLKRCRSDGGNLGCPRQERTGADSRQISAPWKKCDFFTIRRESRNPDGPRPYRVKGYTDQIFNYYKGGGTWHAIHPIWGLSVAWGHTRKEAQAKALERLEYVREIETGNSAQLQKFQKFADMIWNASAMGL